MFFHAASSSEIRDALKDEELQKLICNIDCSPDAVNVSAGELITGDITLCRISVDY